MSMHMCIPMNDISKSALFDVSIPTHTHTFLGHFRQRLLCVCGKEDLCLSDSQSSQMFFGWLNTTHLSL